MNVFGGADDDIIHVDHKPPIITRHAEQSFKVDRKHHSSIHDLAEMPSATDEKAKMPPPRVTPGSAAGLKLPALIPRKPRREPENPLPVPETPQLSEPPDLHDLSPQVPSRRILSNQDLERFQRSPTYALILSFIFSISESCANKKISSVVLSEQRPIVKNLQEILSSISTLVDANPPADQGASRFGNPAFKGFLDSLSTKIDSYHTLLKLPSPDWIPEVSTYLSHSFGSYSRIDYGSGHELNFLIWLLCLQRVSLLQPSDFPALGLCIFPSYLNLLRRIQSTYYLEPAGSHGVWGLDDYHFLPFLFGASQLLKHPYITPKGVHNDLLLEEEGDEFLYLDMVRATVASKSVKGLKWTQPMLDDISSAKNWVKVEAGMRRMFVKEVLGKLPVMQHFLFGSLIPAVEGMSEETAGVGKDVEGVMSSETGRVDAPKHVHDHDGWGDCCGIKIPSTVAAAEEARKSGTGEVLRRVPFD